MLLPSMEPLWWHWMREPREIKIPMCTYIYHISKGKAKEITNFKASLTFPILNKLCILFHDFYLTQYWREKNSRRICQIGYAMTKISSNLDAHLGLHIFTFFFSKTGKGRMNETCSEVNLHLFQRSFIPTSTSITTSWGGSLAGLLTLYQTGLVRWGGSEYSQGCARRLGLSLFCLCWRHSPSFSPWGILLPFD